MSALQGARIAVVGATGAVGLEVLSILAERGVAAEQVVALASERSVGTRLAYGAGELVVGHAHAEAFAGVKHAIFAADSATSVSLALSAISSGAHVIDNSSAFRMKENVPLVVPEINGDLLDRSSGSLLVANPNCSTILLLLALHPLREAFGVREIVVSTYQAVSGAGIAAMQELREQTREVLEGKPPSPRVFAEPCAFNLFSHDSAIDELSGFNGEESKIIAEARKIWSDQALSIIPTCVRVPVLRAHSQAVTVTFKQPATEQQVRQALEHGLGLRIIDDRQRNVFPTPGKASGGDDILVGRVRPAGGTPLGQATDRFCLFLSGDQLRKGAALNAVQIAERLAGSSSHSGRAAAAASR